MWRHPHDETLRLAYAANVSEARTIGSEAVKVQMRSWCRLVDRTGTADGSKGDKGDEFLRICTHGEEGRFCWPNSQVHGAGHPENPMSTKLRVEATADIGAAAADVYSMIADYRIGHRRIIPPKYFRNLEVEEGGYGNGTVIRYDLLAFGQTSHARARVSEPEPGRVLVETDLDKGAVTSFIVEPLAAAQSRVTIATVMATRGGLVGWLERAMTGSFLKRVYVAELALLNAEVQADTK